MNSISARDSLPERWRVCSDGSSRCASQSANTLQKSSRQQESAVISTAIEGVSGTGLEAQSSQTDAVKSLIRWESPHPLSIAGVSQDFRANRFRQYAYWRMRKGHSDKSSGPLRHEARFLPSGRTLPEQYA